MPVDEQSSIESTVSAAELAEARGRPVDAASHYRSLIAHPGAINYEYDEWARRLARIYSELSRSLEAGMVFLYLQDFKSARRAFTAAGAHTELAICFSLEKRWPEAGEEFVLADRPVQAAIVFEEGKDYKRAGELWERLLADRRLRKFPYERALASFNLGMAVQQTGGERRGRGDEVNHLVTAQRLLEEVADEFETRGQRERAFDCYQILLKLGRDAGSFENLSEGYLNCIRVYKEDGLKFEVLFYYEDFIELALERNELYAAATLFQEVAEHAQQSGLPYHRHYLKRSAETWWRAAERGVAEGGPLDAVENAYSSSIGAWSAIGDFGRVGETYQRLSALDLSDRKRKRYQEIAKRYSGATADSQESPSFPDYLRRPAPYPRIWFLDLVEWEVGGDPGEVAAIMTGDDDRYNSSVRRRVLNLALLMVDANVRNVTQSVEVLTRAAKWLGQIHSYMSLNPLERLFEHEDPGVQSAAVLALRFLNYKRSFVLVEKALESEHATVRDAGRTAMAGLHFVHAFQPLARILRKHTDPKVKAVALETIGRIGSVEAGEFLIGVLRQQDDTLGPVAGRALAEFKNNDLAPILRQHLELERNEVVRQAFSETLARLGQPAFAG